MAFVIHLIKIIIAVAIVYIVVETAASVCGVGLRGLSEVVENKRPYYPKLASCLSFFKSPDFFLLLTAALIVWFLRDKPISVFISFGSDKKSNEQLFLQAITADLGLTALLSLAITFFGSIKNRYEDNKYLGSNINLVYLQTYWPFRLARSQFFGLSILFLYFIPMGVAALRAIYGDDQKCFTQFSQDSWPFDIWLSLYCVGLLVLIFSVYMALTFDGSTDWVSYKGQKLIEQKTTHTFHGYLNEDIRNARNADPIGQLESDIGQLDDNQSKITYIKYAFGDWLGLDTEEPIYAALHLTDSGKRNKLNDFTRSVVDLDKRLLNVALYLKRKWRFLYNAGLEASPDFIEVLASQRYEDKGLLDKISALWPDLYAKYFNDTRVDLSESMSLWPEDENEPKLDVVQAMIEQCYGNLVCRNGDKDGSEAWLSKMLQGPFEGKTSEDKTTQSVVQKNTGDYLFKQAVSLLPQMLGDSKVEEIWDNQRQQEYWLESICPNPTLNQSRNRAVLDELWSFISSPDLSRIPEWSLKSVYDLLPFEKKLSHLLWIGAYRSSDEQRELQVAQHYDVYRNGLQKDNPLIDGGTCKLKGGRKITKTDLKSAVWNDLEHASHSIDSWCSQDEIGKVVDGLFDSSITEEFLDCYGNRRYSSLYLLALKSCLQSEWEVCQQLDGLFAESESLSIGRLTRKGIELYKQKYPEVMPEVIKRLEFFESEE
ncbi:hypothetical protein [Bifidobacterium sp. ESL0800]|uniref:hypothetical protein n=1 Tax=Bifidobacterium sp. ESL0800 TaxID=2983236 RepID=UPI0023F76902|nr:hypothetical protein [Bifidobacterium sp. ESL0800]WEV75270.1 hypothetical protein OZX75_06435 [Bifidobacterium sp. ESL0800]